MQSHWASDFGGLRLHTTQLARSSLLKKKYLRAGGHYWDYNAPASTLLSNLGFAHHHPPALLRFFFKHSMTEEGWEVNFLVLEIAAVGERMHLKCIPFPTDTPESFFLETLGEECFYNSREATWGWQSQSKAKKSQSRLVADNTPCGNTRTSSDAGVLSSHCQLRSDLLPRLRVTWKQKLIERKGSGGFLREVRMSWSFTSLFRP